MLEFNKASAEFVSLFIESFAVLLIGFTILIVIVNNLVHLFQKDEARFNKWRSRSWRGIQGSLDLFIASDILSTITVNRTIEGVATLGILLIVRTFVSWSLELEIEGCWPWQRRALQKKEELTKSSN